MGWGIMILTNGAYLPGVMLICTYFSMLGIKRWLTYPRIGYAKISATSRRRIGTGFVILLTGVLLMGVLISILWGINTRPQWLVDYFPVLFSGMLAAIVCLVAYWIKVNRFYLHAALIFLAAVVHQWLSVQWEYGFIGAGTLIILIGLGYLISFLRKYPKTHEEIEGNVN